jgi:hypothetical protein
MREIHTQDCYGRSAKGSATDQNRTIPVEMPRPLVPPGVKESSEFLGDRVDASQVRPFVQIVLVTREGQIRWRICTAVLTGDDVLDVEREERIILFMELAVFAALSRA